MLVTFDHQTIHCPPGDTYQSLAEARCPDRRILAVRVGGETLPLTTAPHEGDCAQGITLTDAEGGLIYERSLRFVFLLAMRQLYPDCRVRLEHSVGRGVYGTVSGLLLTEGRLEEIKARMRDIIARDLPFERVEMSREQAIAYFEQCGESDKVRLLRYRPSERFTLYRAGDMMEYFYGVMTPSTGYTPVFDLALQLPGLVLLLPQEDAPDRPAQPVQLPKLMKTFAQSARWDRILGCKNAADLNEMVEKRSLREFIRVNEALQEKAISSIADQCAASGARVLLVAGPSSSGKTTFTHRLSIALKVLGLRPLQLSLDDYYLDRDAIEPEPDGTLDLEKLSTLDVPLFNEHLVRLLQGETAVTPTFDFTAGKRGAQTHCLRADPDQPILIEGIHGLNDELTASVSRDNKFKVYISALTTLNLDDHNRIRTTDARLLRRLVRDYQFRGTPPERTFEMWPSVRRGEERYIFPFQEEADVMFNSSLDYEMAILKKYVYPHLLAITPDSPHYTMARRLVKFLNYFQTADVEDEIPVNSILREFIGGCCFYRNAD